MTSDQRRAQAVSALREVLAIRPTDEYGRKLTSALEMLIHDAAETANRADRKDAYQCGLQTQADSTIFLLYGFLIGNVPDEWLTKEVEV